MMGPRAWRTVIPIPIPISKVSISTFFISDRNRIKRSHDILSTHHCHVVDGKEIIIHGIWSSEDISKANLTTFGKNKI
jgi:hypothetical protein